MEQKKRKRPDHNYKKLDAKVRFHYKDDLLKAVKKHDFKYVSQYVYDRYYRHKDPGSIIAKSLPITTSAVFSWMRQWGFTSRGRGGNTKNPILKDKKVIKKIMDLKGRLSVVEAAEICGCSSTSVLKLWKKEDETL